MRRSILSINSNRSMNFLLRTVLSGKQNFVAVNDVYQAMDELKRGENIGVVLVDMDYHTNENVDFIQHIVTSSLYQDVPLILLSSNRNIGIELGLENCFLFYKPFSPIELSLKVNELVQLKYEKI